MPLEHAPFGHRFRMSAITTIVPFTRRNGDTYLTILEKLADYLGELVKVLNKNNENIVVEVNAALAQIRGEVDSVLDLYTEELDSKLANFDADYATKLTELQQRVDVGVQTVNDAIDSFNNTTNDKIAEINGLIADFTANIDTKIANLTTYVDDAIEQVINSSIELQDPAVSALVNDSESETGGAVRALIGESLKNLDGIKHPRVNRNWYVSPSGSDSNDGSELSPFKTIQKLFNELPQVTNVDHFCYISDGVYDEEADLHGVIGGSVQFLRKGGAKPPTSDTGVFIRSLRFYDCTAYIFVQSVTFLERDGMSAKSQVLFSRVSYGTVNGCRAVRPSATDKPTFTWDGSGGGASSNVFNAQSVALYANNGSRIRVDSTNSVVGTNVTDLSVDSSTAFINGSGGWISSRLTGRGGEIRLSDEPFRQRGLIVVKGNNTGLLTHELVPPIPLRIITSVQLTFVGARTSADPKPTDVRGFTTNLATFKALTTTAASTYSGLIVRATSDNFSDSFWFGISWQIEGVF